MESMNTSRIPHTT
jgi:hypothetical protein